MAFVGKWIGLTTHASAQSAGGDAQDGTAKAVAIVKAEYKRFGLENFGNTCYVNSVLQALYFCHPFRELVLQIPDRSNPVAPVVFSTEPPPVDTASNTPRIKYVRKPSSPEVRQVVDQTTQSTSVKPTGPMIPSQPPSMFSALRALFLHISHNTLDRGVVAPRAFVDKLRKENEYFRNSMHQDAHEFLNYLLNKVSEDLEDEVRKERSRSSSGEDLSHSGTSSALPSLIPSNGRSAPGLTLIQTLFEGILTSETRCLTCETVSSREEAFLDLSIDIEQNSSVTACLRQFSASEMLCQKNKFFCDSCCGLQEAEKRMKIKRLPNVLALHLKRFKFQEDLQKYIKLTYRVAFPLELRLFNTVDDADDPDRLYELFAIVVHIGNGPNHGHYIAIVKSRGVWVVFDDDAVDTIKENDIPKYFGDSNSGSAYVLYYQAVDLDLASLGLRLSEQVSTSPAPAPAATPGLSHDGESERSEPVPITPSSSPNNVSPLMKVAIPSLSVSIPPPESSLPISVQAPSGTSSSPSHKSSFFSLRHSPSKANVTSHGGPVITSSAPFVPPVPSLPGEKVQAESSQSSTSTSTSASALASGVVSLNGSKSSGGWFTRRRTSKAEKPSDSVLRALQTPIARREVNDDASLSSSRASTSSHSKASTSKQPEDTQTHNHHRPFGHHYASSTHGPNGVRPSQRKSSDVPNSSNGTLSMKATPSSSSSQALPLTPHTSPRSPGHKRSQPSLLPVSPGPPLRPAKSIKRPTTSSGSVPGHSFARNHDTRLSEGVDRPHPPLPSSNPLPRPRPRNTEAHDAAPLRRNSVAVGSFPLASPSLKRPPRKLSLTGNFLGFGRKDKDKDRDKQQKEKDNRQGSLPIAA